MRVAILGTGGIGRGMAVFLAANGHFPVLWSPTGTGLQPPSVELVSTGIVDGRHILAVAGSCGAAVAGADAVLVAVTGNGLRATLDALGAVLCTGQVVIVSGHLSFAALYLSRLIAGRGVRAPIAAWATTALTARRGPGASVHVSGRRARLDVATLPIAASERGLAVCRALFGDRFEPKPDLLAVSLSNLNPPSHLANMLCNFTRAEKGEAWQNYAGITPSVARLMLALDRERLDLAAAFGLSVRTIEDHFVASFPVTPAPLQDMAREVASQRRELMGPATLDTRFVTEDVPFGLVPLVMLGEMAGVALPLHAGGIALMSALYGRDFRAENDLLPALDLCGWTPDRLHGALRDGWAG